MVEEQAKMREFGKEKVMVNRVKGFGDIMKNNTNKLFSICWQRKQYAYTYNYGASCSLPFCASEELCVATDW